MALTPTPLTCGWQADGRVEKKNVCLYLHMQPFSVKFRNVTVHVQLTFNLLLQIHFYSFKCHSCSYITLMKVF